jgi:hypothetical protein
VRSFGIGVVRWLFGLLFGAFAAAIVFVLAALIAGKGTGAGALGMLILGFALALFPSILAAGTSSPRGVVRRAAIVYAVLGLLIAGIEGYQLVTGASLFAPGTFDVVSQIEGLGISAAELVVPLFGAIGGIFVVLISFILFLLLRGPRRAAAPSTEKTKPAAGAPAAKPAVSPAEPTRQVAPPTAKPTPTAAPPAAAKPGLDDEDARLMADLENLRKKLPKMGGDQ